MRNNKIKRHIGSNFRLYFLFSCILVLGVVIGGIIANLVPQETCKKSAESLGLAISNLSKGTAQWTVIYFFTSSSKPVLSMWLAGFWRYGIWIIMATLCYKGAAMGFSVALFVRMYQMRGVALSAVGILPQHIILLPLYVIVAVLSIDIGRGMVTSRSYKMLPTYIAILIASVALCVAATAIDTYISSWLIGSLAYMIE